MLFRFALSAVTSFRRLSFLLLFFVNFVFCFFVLKSTTGPRFVGLNKYGLLTFVPVERADKLRLGPTDEKDYYNIVSVLSENEVLTVTEKNVVKFAEKDKKNLSRQKFLFESQGGNSLKIQNVNKMCVTYQKERNKFVLDICSSSKPSQDFNMLKDFDEELGDQYRKRQYEAFKGGYKNIVKSLSDLSDQDEKLHLQKEYVDSYEAKHPEKKEAIKKIAPAKNVLNGKLKRDKAKNIGLSARKDMMDKIFNSEIDSKQTS